MTLNSPGLAPLFSLTVPPGEAGAARVIYTIRANGNSNQLATETGTINVLTTATSTTCNVSQDSKLHLGTVNSDSVPASTTPAPNWACRYSTTCSSALPRRSSLTRYTSRSRTSRT